MIEKYNGDSLKQEPNSSIVILLWDEEYQSRM